MPDTIDSLQIEIQANAAAANQSISKLATQLYKLKGALNGMNVGGLRSLSSSLQNFGSAMQMASSYKMPDFNRIASGITRLSNVDAAAITTAAGAIRQMGNSLSSLGTVSGGAAQISELASAISRMGYKSATTAISNIPLLANAFRELMTTLSTAPRVSQNVIDLANAMANLSANGVRVSTSTSRATSSLNLFGATAGKTAKKTKSLAAVFGKLYATYFLLFRGFHKIAQAIDISSNLTEVQNVVSTTFGSMTNKMEEFAETSITEFGLSELAAKQYASRFQAMGVSMGLSGRQIENATQGLAHLRGAYGETSTSMADMSLNLTRLTADMASFYNMEQDLVAEDLQAIFTGMTKPLRKFGLDITDASLKAYALSKGMDANTKSMSQAEKTMLRYMYVMEHTSHVQGDFAKTSLTWANQIRILKQNFERLARVIGDGFIAALRPLVVKVNQAMNSIIAAVTRVINALGKIFGWQMVIDVGGGDLVDDAEDLADGYDDATDSAKKFKNFLLGIDELNVMPDNSDDDGGGGAGGLGDLGGLGDIDPGSIDFVDYESDLDNLFKLGDAIGRKLTEMMENIDWDSIYEKARNFGKGLADFLNGLISPELFYQVGRTIANALNAAIYAELTFAENFNWTNFGASLASGINGFFENFDFISAAKNINTWANGLLDALIEALDNIKWETIGEKIGDFLAEIDFTGIFKKVAIAIWKALSGALKAYDSAFDKAPVETILLSLVGLTKLLKVKGIQNFAKAIGEVLKKLNTLSLVTKNKGFLTGLTVAFEGLDRPVNRVLASLETFHVSMTGGEGYVKSFNAGIAKLTENLSPLAKGLIGVGGAVADFALVSDSIHDLASGTENVGANIAELFAGIAVGATSLIAVLGFPAGLAAALAVTLVGAIKGVADAMEEAHLERMGEAITSSFESGGVPISDIIDSVTSSINTAASGFADFNAKSADLQTTRNNIEDVWREIDNIQTAMDNGVLSVEEGQSKLSSLFSELATLTATEFEQITSSITSLYGEGGALSGYYSNTESLINATIEAQYTNVERAKELADIMSSSEFGSEAYNAAYKELQNLRPGIDEASKALSDFQYAVSGMEVDYSGFMLDDGTLDVSAVEATLGEMQNAYEAYSTNLDEVGKEVKAQLEALYNASSDPQARAEFKNALDELPNNIKSMKENAALELQEVTDNIQTAFVDNIPGIIEQAQADWEGLSWVEKFFKWGNDEDAYVKTYTDNYSGVIDTLSSNIETTFGEMGVNGAGWAKDATSQMLDAMFTEFEGMSTYGTQTPAILADNWREIFDKTVSNVGNYGYDTFKPLGEDSVKGQADGVTSSESILTDAITDVEESAIESAKTALDSHSPSRVFWDIGHDQDEGQANGIRDNETLVTDAVAALIDNMRSMFGSLPDEMFAIGASIGNSLASGVSSAASAVGSAISSITQSINDAMKAIDDLNNAAKNLNTGGGSGSGGKKKKTFATGGFPEDGIFFANHGELVGQFSNGKTAVANNAQIVAGIESGVYNAVKSAMGGGGGSQPITVYLDGKVVYDSVVSQNNRQIARTGRSSLRV